MNDFQNLQQAFIKLRQDFVSIIMNQEFLIRLENHVSVCEFKFDKNGAFLYWTSESKTK